MTAVVTGMSSPRSSRWTVAMLVASLALNLVVIGAVASFLWRQQFDPPGAASEGGFVARHVLGYAVALPRERVEELEKLTEQEWQRVRPLRRALLEARDEARKALTAEPFDRQRYLEARSKVLAADQKSREATLALHTAIGLHLTPEERRGFLRWRDQQRPPPQNPLDVPGKPGK
jgi:Spy/CpxP family protein refolding chaperone